METFNGMLAFVRHIMHNTGDDGFSLFY